MSKSMQKSPGYTITSRTSPEGKNAFKTSQKVPVLWVMLRFLSRKEQEVPNWGVFVSVTGQAPALLTTIDYYPPINHPIIDFKTVQDCLQYSEEATKEVGQQYVIISFDLGVCMKVYPLV